MKSTQSPSTTEHPKSDRLRFWQEDLVFLRQYRHGFQQLDRAGYRRDVRLRLERCMAARRDA